MKHDAKSKTAPNHAAWIVDAYLHYDVAIVGGGMAGFVAAVAAARSGAKTLIVEQNAYFGGAATAGVVSQFVGWKTRSGKQVVRGLASEIVGRLRSRGGCGPIENFVMSTGHTMNRVQFDAQILKGVLDEILLEAHVDFLFKSILVGTEVVSGSVREIIIWSAGKLLGVRAATYVDASGDMALLKSANANFLELEEGERLQPATMMFAMGPIEFERLDALGPEEKQKIITKGLDSGSLPRAALHYSRSPGQDEAWFNISRVSVDPEDPFSLSQGEVEGRRQALAIAEFLRDNLPGCEAARLRSIAPQLGIRDSRRVLGDYVIDVEDLRSGQNFPDTIACGAYPIDVHHPDRSDLTFEEFGSEHYYNIPFRALIPANLTNVVAAGRGISADHDAFAALRVMPTSMAIGHAAGLAAAAASERSQGTVRVINLSALQTALKAQGAFLGDR